MKVCGVELKANDAIICILSLTNGLFATHECRVKRFSIPNVADAEELKKFQFDFAKLMEDYQVDHVVIRERMTRGKFAGGAAGFKLEAAIQLSETLNVSLLSSAQSKEIMKASHLQMNFSDTGLKQFQETAFMTALSYLER